MDAIYYCCCFLLITISLLSHDLHDTTTASPSPKLALSSCLLCVNSLQPSTDIPVLHPHPGYFLSLSNPGSLHNGLFKDRPHRYAREIKQRARCRLGMSVQPDSCYFHEYPCLHKTCGKIQSLLHQIIYYTCTSLSAVAHSLLPFSKVAAMSNAFNSKDVYEVFAMVEQVAGTLGIPINQITRNQSPDAFCLILKTADLAANTDRALLARGSFNDLPFELQAYQIDQMVGLKPKFGLTEVSSSLAPRPSPLSLYHDYSGMTRITQLDSDVESLHNTVRRFNSTFAPPVQEDSAAKIIKLTALYEAAKTRVEDHYAASALNDFDLEDNKVKLTEQASLHLELELRLKEARAVVQTLSEQLTVSAQTRSSSSEGTDQQDATTDQLQIANAELNEANTEFATSTDLLKELKEENKAFKASQRGYLVRIRPLNRATAEEKQRLVDYQSTQGKNGIHIQLKDRGYGVKFAPQRARLVDHITTTRQARADLFDHGKQINPTIGLDMFSDRFITHITQIVAFDCYWTGLINHAINMPTNDDKTTCKMMREENRSEAAYDACSFTRTSFIESLFDMELSFSKTIVAVNRIFPTPKIAEYHTTVMKSLEDISFYIRDGHEVLFNEKAVRDVGTHLNKSNSSGRPFPTVDFIMETVGKAAASSSGFEKIAQAREPARSLLDSVIVKMRAHVNDDFQTFGRDPVDLAKLMNDFHTTMVQQQSLALANNLLLCDQRLHTGKIKSLAAAQRPSSGNGQEASKSGNGQEAPDFKRRKRFEMPTKIAQEPEMRAAYEKVESQDGRLKSLMASTDQDNQRFSPCQFRKDYRICTLQLKGLPCTDGCSLEQHGQFGYAPRQMLYYMRQPDYCNIEMFENMVRWSVKWVNKYEQNMKRGNATPARTPTRSYGSSGERHQSIS